MLPFDVALPTVHPGVSQNYFYRKRRWRCLIPVGIWGCLHIRETHQCSQEPLTHHHHPSKSLFLGRVVIVSKFKSHLKFASAVARAALFVSGKSADHLFFLQVIFAIFVNETITMAWWLRGYLTAWNGRDEILDGNSRWIWMYFYLLGWRNQFKNWLREWFFFLVSCVFNFFVPRTKIYRKCDGMEPI